MRAYATIRAEPQDHLREINARLQKRLPEPWHRTINRVEDFHINVGYLDDVTDGQVELMTALCLRINQDIMPARIGLRAFIGQFKDTKRPRDSLLWVGADDLDGNLQKAWDRITQEAQAAGITHPKYGFRPHVTLVRMRTRPGHRADLPRARREIQQHIEPVEWTAGEMKLQVRLTGATPGH